MCIFILTLISNCCIYCCLGTIFHSFFFLYLISLFRSPFAQKLLTKHHSMCILYLHHLQIVLFIFCLGTIFHSFFSSLVTPIFFKFFSFRNLTNS
jgi:hypothetical protein